MKIAILAAALLGTAAVAQTTVQTAPADTNTTQPDDLEATQPTDQTTTALPSQNMTDDTGAMAPAGVNEPVNAPPGARVIVNPNQAAAFAPRPATGTYPPCSAGQTDSCTQTNERGMRRPRG